MSALNALTEWLSTTKSTSSAFLNVHLTLSGLADDAPAKAEALKLLTAAIEKLALVAKENKKDDLFVVCYTTEEAAIRRTRRAIDNKVKGDPIVSHCHWYWLNVYRSHC